MTTTTKTEDHTDRLYTPTEEEVDEYSRLYMTVENARKTLLREKTQTRRIINPQPDEVIDGRPIKFVSHEVVDLENDELVERTHGDSGGRFCEEIEPEYNVGETRLITTPHWRANDGDEVRIFDEATATVRYESRSGHLLGEPNWEMGEWHQIHASFLMPTWASRIAVKVTDVWVERVQEISDEDARAEGMRFDESKYPGDPPDPVVMFSALWDDLHGMGAWERNDWVRCVEYELITQ